MFNFKTDNIRNTFIDYFKKNGHHQFPASSLIPHNDPSLMFVNSGMVQFKELFTGQEQINYKRAVSSQKAVRAGGKHNDLENVGYTARHHTFFEMLGNFSFGDYFKEQAIYYAWDLLTNEFAIPKNRLYVTVYHTDDEAAKFWQKIAGLGEDRIIKIKTNDNFWTMGDLGPCGPCSEIFYDHGEHIFGGLPGTAQQDGDRFVEIWNMVFMQFEQIGNNTQIELPNKSIDTGMGLERVAAVLQGTHDNYDIDLFKDLINYTQDILGVKNTDNTKHSYRIIADHLRACSFLIADGVMPSNEGRGYVLRRIMRRSMRHAHKLGAKDPLMHQLFPKLLDLMGSFYPELARAADFITEVLKQEEIRFRSTLDRGLKLLAEETCNLQSNNEKKLSGSIAFKLYDTYGFPIDLTEDILKEQSIDIDHEAFNIEMTQQKQRARSSWAGSGESKVGQIWFDMKLELGATEFLGYSSNTIEAKIIALVKDNLRVDAISDIDQQFILISNQTPFYGESGGQMGDIGIIENNDLKIRVIDTQKYLNSIYGHVCLLEKGTVKVGQNAKFHIDANHRNSLRAHHSATHILHAVLRQVLGKHVTQKGSLVASDRIRFDISHALALSRSEIHLIEDKVNQIIFENYEIHTKLMSTEDAIDAGAMALFGEKYESEVRVVSMQFSDNESHYSLELCGGTHATRTGDIGIFKIISENAVAAGIRRIEAVCGTSALKILRENEESINQIADVLKSSKSDIYQKLNFLLKSKKELETEILTLKLATLDKISQELISINDKVRFVFKNIEGFDAKTIRIAAEQLSLKANDIIAIYVSIVDEKISAVIAVSKLLTAQLSAADIARMVVEHFGGKGGGSISLAQVGGIDSNRFSSMSAKIKDYIENISQNM